MSSQRRYHEQVNEVLISAPLKALMRLLRQPPRRINRTVILPSTLGREFKPHGEKGTACKLIYWLIVRFWPDAAFGQGLLWVGNRHEARKRAMEQTRSIADPRVSAQA